MIACVKIGLLLLVGASWLVQVWRVALVQSTSGDHMALDVEKAVHKMIELVLVAASG